MLLLRRTSDEERLKLDYYLIFEVVCVPHCHHTPSYTPGVDIVFLGAPLFLTENNK